jgi:hypothetical protein
LDDLDSSLFPGYGEYLGDRTSIPPTTPNYPPLPFFNISVEKSKPGLLYLLANLPEGNYQVNIRLYTSIFIENNYQLKMG